VDERGAEATFGGRPPKDRSRVEVPINIFAPRAEDGAWSCRYEIGWPEGQEARDAWGIDSVQALLLALQMIGADLHE
jgi:hypothetical protein